MTKKTFNSMMNFLMNSKGTLINDERVLTYWQVLYEYPDEYVKKATLNCVKKYDFFPTISQIVREFEACEEEKIRESSYVKKIEAPRHVDKGIKWLRQIRILLSCSKGTDINYSKLYSDEELKYIVEKKGGDKRLLYEDEIMVSTNTRKEEVKNEIEVGK